MGAFAMRTLQTVVKADRTARGRASQQDVGDSLAGIAGNGRRLVGVAQKRQEPRSLLRPHDECGNTLQLTFEPLWRVVGPSPGTARV